MEGVRDDVHELRQARRDDAVRISAVERAVQRMGDFQQAARRAEERQYRRVANAVALGGLAMAAAMVILALVTFIYGR